MENDRVRISTALSCYDSSQRTGFTLTKANNSQFRRSDYTPRVVSLRRLRVRAEVVGELNDDEAQEPHAVVAPVTVRILRGAKAWTDYLSLALHRRPNVRRLCIPGKKMNPRVGTA